MLKELVVKLENIEALLLTQKNVLNVSEVLLLTGLSKSYMYKLTSTGGIPCYKPQGKQIFFKKDEVESWLLQNRKATNKELDALASTYTTLK
ncbi:MAG: DNA-binding protein [Bacteroidetes bacterium]|nr:MAG: DNA-binding protein [Bacteroidota bacterium]